MSAPREIPDRREELSSGRVRLWFAFEGGQLASCTVTAGMLTDETIERIAATLEAERMAPPPRPQYGDGQTRRHG